MGHSLENVTEEEEEDSVIIPSTRLAVLSNEASRQPNPTAEYYVTAKDGQYEWMHQSILSTNRVHLRDPSSYSLASGASPFHFRSYQVDQPLPSARSKAPQEFKFNNERKSLTQR